MKILRNFISGFALSSLLAAPSVAQEISTEWLETVGALCQGQFSFEAELQGELSVVRLLNLIEPGAEGSANIDLTDLNRLLDQFAGDEKRDVLSQYYQCIEGFVIAATSNRSVESGVIALSESIVPSTIAVVPAGNRFVLNPSDTVGLGSLDILLTYKEFHGYSADTRFSFTDTGRDDNERFDEGKAYQLRSANCSVTMYDLDQGNGAASFFFRC